MSQNNDGYNGALDDITLLLQGIVAAPADFNEDGSVDLLDLTKWEGDYGSGPDSDADGDLDSDGADYLAWQRQFTGSPAIASSSKGVPEASSLTLFDPSRVTAVGAEAGRVLSYVVRNCF